MTIPVEATKLQFPDDQPECSPADANCGDEQVGESTNPLSPGDRRSIQINCDVQKKTGTFEKNVPRAEECEGTNYSDMELASFSIEIISQVALL